MNFNDYRPLALRTAKIMPTAADELDHALIGLMTENGEFASEIKRVFAYGKPLTEAMNLHCREELGDAQFYVPLAMRALSIDELPLLNEHAIESVAPFLSSLKSVTLGIGMLAGGMVAVSLESPTPSEDGAEVLAMINYLIDRGAVLLGTTGDQLRVENIDKLRKRYPEGYTDLAAEARADKDGADHRTS